MRKFLILFALLMLLFDLFGANPVVAVLPISNKTKGQSKLSEDDIDNIYEAIRSELIQADRYEVMSKDEVETQTEIGKHRKKSHQLDISREYAIELGKKTAAKFIITAKISTDRTRYQVVSEMIDLEKTSSPISAKTYFSTNLDDFDSRDAAISDLVMQLIGEKKKSFKKKISEGQRFCEEARISGSEQKWRSFLKYYAEEYPECVPEANKQLEEIAFHKAERGNSIEAWQQYLDEYPMANKRHVIFAEEQIEKLKKGAIKERSSGKTSDSDNNAMAILGNLFPEYNEYMKIKFDNITFPTEHKGYELLQLGFDVENGRVIHHGDFDPNELYPDEKNLVKAAAKIKDEFNKIFQERISKKTELAVALSKTLESKVYPGQTKAVFYYIGKIYKDLADQTSKAPVTPWLNEAQISEYKNYLNEKAFGAAKNAVTYFNLVVKESISSEWIDKAKQELQQIKRNYNLD